MTPCGLDRTRQVLDCVVFSCSIQAVAQEESQELHEGLKIAMYIVFPIKLENILKEFC